MRPINRIEVVKQQKFSFVTERQRNLMIHFEQKQTNTNNNKRKKKQSEEYMGVTSDDYNRCENFVLLFVIKVT